MMDDYPDVTTIPPGARRLAIGGELWWVYEDSRVDAPYYGPALIFKADRMARRVRNYPTDWRALSDEQLYALSWTH